MNGLVLFCLFSAYNNNPSLFLGACLSALFCTFPEYPIFSHYTLTVLTSISRRPLAISEEIAHLFFWYTLGGTTHMRELTCTREFCRMYGLWFVYSPSLWYVCRIICAFLNSFLICFWRYRSIANNTIKKIVPMVTGNKTLRKFVIASHPV